VSEDVYCYKWCTFLENREHTHCISDIAPALDQLVRGGIFDEPLPLRRWPAGVEFETEGTAPEDVPAFVRWPLVSDRLRLLIESNGLTGAGFYPVEMKSSLPVPIPRYWYLHLHQLADAIDFERSTWMRLPIKWEGKTLMATSVLKYVLKRKVVEGWDLFRCIEEEISDKKRASSAIFCSERFRALFVEHGCTGLEFIRVPLSD